MGNFASRGNAGVEEVDITTSNAYRYPPKSGCYFGSHFIMGGERFETTQPEGYLFGDNQDLNFLGSRPTPFPYPAPQAHEPTKTLKSLVNIRKDSLKFVKVADAEACKRTEEGEEGEDGEKKPSIKYNVEFTFDSDARCAITIYYFATEEISGGQAIYHPRDSAMNSETYHYKRGANQTFNQTTHLIEPSKHPEEEWLYNPEKDFIPVVIQCVVEDEPERVGHAHMTFAVVERSLEGSYSLKPLKQKQMVDGLCYLLQEIYGIENKNTERAKLEDDWDDNGSECVICMCEIRDTLILPCRHLCLCNACADNLRYQASNCPICRAPFRALLQIRAMRRKISSLPAAQHTDSSDETSVSQEGVPAGYEAVPLIEALNGPATPTSPATAPSLPPDETRHPVPSLPPTRDGSPILDKRKTRRQSGGRSSAKSSRAVSPVEEVREQVREKGTRSKPKHPEKDQRSGTPEVVMSDCAPVTKSPVSRRAVTLPRIRFPSKKKATVEAGRMARTNSLELVSETKNKKVPREGASSDGELVVGAVGGPYPPTPPPDYDDIADNDVTNEDIDESRLPADGSMLYESGPQGESDPLFLPSHCLDPSLPGTPQSTTDGSSYSSTSSTKGLLSHPTPPSAVAPAENV